MLSQNASLLIVVVNVCLLCIILTDVLHVLNRDARAKKFAFQILATGCKYHLAAESAEDRERWVQGLKRLLFGPPQLGVVCEPLA